MSQVSYSLASSIWESLWERRKRQQQEGKITHIQYRPNRKWVEEAVKHKWEEKVVLLFLSVALILFSVSLEFTHFVSINDTNVYVHKLSSYSIPFFFFSSEPHTSLIMCYLFSHFFFDIHANRLTVNYWRDDKSCFVKMKSGVSRWRGDTNDE
jgi:hypothetical protein